MEENSGCKVCVTGSSGYLGSWIVKRLLEKGYIVHATLRNLGDPNKVGLLKSLPNGERNLRLFEADIYSPNDYERAIQGCKYVIHLATPVLRDFKDESNQIEETSEAAVGGIRSMMESCRRSGTVKRLIYTASVVAASPIQDDGKAFKPSMDESCWTPLNISFPYANQGLMAYTHSKTLSEKELLRFNGDEGGKLEVVSLNCGVVGGDTILSIMPESMAMLVSQIIDNKRYAVLRFLEEVNGKVPIVHIEDVCDAHIFCMEKSSLNGRFLCASAYLASAEIASHWRKYHPDINIAEELVEDLGRDIVWGSTKLKEIGFEYKFNAKMILDGSLQCAQRMDYFCSTD
ncbi:NAD(P)-binding domain containing protein [Trema orientale]|uniref:NAD(P)-binding domain containing protein n=1 Tax=Trema orientale TaxID=63057 RepID=A0A2P5FIA9_TREOI|nr:NAD(P)-binding domain containing protein [Trema orientale]